MTCITQAVVCVANLSVGWCDGSSDRSLMVDLLNCFSFEPVLHDLYNTGCSMCC